jgi:hypothetical protein
MSSERWPSNLSSPTQQHQEVACRVVEQFSKQGRTTVKGSVDLGRNDDAVAWDPTDPQPAAQELLAASVRLPAYISAESKKLTRASKAVLRRRSELAAPFCSPIVIVPARTQYAPAESVRAEPQRERGRDRSRGGRLGGKSGASWKVGIAREDVCRRKLDDCIV